MNTTLPEKRESGKGSFFDRYKALTRKEKPKFRDKILSWVKKQPGTFQQWMRTKNIPELDQTVIAREMGVPQEILFPQLEQN